MQSRLQRSRKRAALTQQQAATALGVPREMISMWENGSRTPKAERLPELAELYGVSVDHLRGKTSGEESEEQDVLYRAGSPDHKLEKKAREEVDRWTDFLDGWAEFLEITGEIEQDEISPDRPPQELNEGFGITDARRASTLASKVREHYDLGQDAIPDLYSFLDEAGVLVYKTSLSPVSQGGDTVSGAFFNHPQVGYSILVNVHCSEGRQAFTLAHEFAHALFHYQSRGLVSVASDDQPRERFANAFAAYFLVPARRLRRLCRREKERKGGLTPYSALRFAAYFRVSYLMMLFRLHEERQITRDKVDEWQDYSPRSMAERIGLDPDFLMSPKYPPFGLSEGDDIYRYPVSVIEQIRDALLRSQITPERATKILNVDTDPRDLKEQLVNIPKKEDGGDEDLDEYPVRWRSV